VISDSRGRFKLPGLPNGTFTLEAGQATNPTNVVAGCFKNNPPFNYVFDCAKASNITVHNADVLNLHIGLPNGHKLFGIAKNHQGHAQCANLIATRTSPAFQTYVASGCGTVTINSLGTGDYTLQATPAGTSHFVNGFYAMTPAHWTEFGPGASLHVGSSGFNAGTIEPDVGDTISGTLERSDETPIPHASVMLYGNGALQKLTYTGPNGGFTFPGVGSGTHAIGVATGTSNVNVQPGYYDQGAPGNFTTDSDNETVLSAGANHVGIVVKLTTGFTISGEVTDHSTNPIKALVYVSDPNTGAFGSASTDSNGDYIVRSLRAGNFQVHVYPVEAVSAPVHHRGGYYDKNGNRHFTPIIGNATIVSVGP
jgi:hypothetical protein